MLSNFLKFGKQLFTTSCLRFSCVEKLNLYGFKRLATRGSSGAYYHELFLRGREALAGRMVRQKIKGTGCKQRIDSTTEPDFYNMEPQPPSSGARREGGDIDPKER
jgi:hypothetical protein